MNDVGRIESIVAVKKNHHADEQGEEAMVSADGSAGDFLAHIDHERRTRAKRSMIAADGLLGRISAFRRF
jgi:hypothetical protein